MKWSSLLGGSALLLLLVGCRETSKVSPSRPSSEPVPTSSAQPLLTVEGITVRYNGQRLPWDDLGPWKQALGPPSREVMGILVWDDLGVNVFDQDDKRPGPESIHVQLGRTMHSASTEGEPEHWPRKLFSGRFTVDGAVIAPGSTLNDINRDKKKPFFERGYMSGVYSYDLEGFYVRLDYGHDRTLTSFALAKHLPE